MSTPAAPSLLRSLLLKDDDTSVLQVAYSVEDAIAAMGASPKTTWRLVRGGDLPTRNTGQQYRISGAVIVDIMGSKVNGINDPRKVIDPARLYFLKHCATFLGVSYGIAHRLTQQSKLTPSRTNGRLLFPGSTILDYLAGRDEPLRASA